MTTYEPGTVAIVTWDNASLASKGQGVSDVRSERAIRTVDGHWSLTSGWNFAITDSSPTDVRPLVVLDLDAIDLTADGLVNHLRWLARHTHPAMSLDQDKMQHASSCGKVAALADQIEAHDPEDPINGRKQWVHGEPTHAGNDWHCGEYHRLWSELVDPVLVRDGIEDGAS